MAILFGLLSAFAYGASDFAAGVGGRRFGAGWVTLVVQVLAFLLAVLGLAVETGNGPTTNALTWGLAAGVGSAVGTFALFRGFVVGRMSVVAPLSAVIAAVLPALVGIALGDQLSPLAGAGLILAIPAIGLVAWHKEASETNNGRPGLIEGLISGAGFAVLFIALHRAGTDAGSWPLVPGLALASLLVLPFALREPRPRNVDASAIALLAAAGVLGGLANLLYLIAGGLGQLSIVAVLTALYPAVTILLARMILDERWNKAQAFGLVAAAAAISLITLG